MKYYFPCGYVSSASVGIYEIENGFCSKFTKGLDIA